jgi:hypothetical protein
MQMNYDRLHGRTACKPLPCCNQFPCTPTIRLDARLLLTTTSTTHYICDVMHGGWLFVSGSGTWCWEHGNNLVMNLRRSWCGSWVCGEGRVDRAGYTTSLARGCYLGISPWEVPVAGACDRERSRGGVSLWNEALGWRCYFSIGHRMSHRALH